MTTNVSRSPRVWLGPTVLLAALAVAIAGAVVTGSQLGGITREVEAVAAGSGSLLARFSQFFPLGFAFSAGMVSAVNPCGFVMLPAYLGLYVGDRDEGAASRGIAWRFQRAVLVGMTVTVGFVLMFALVGTPISLGARGVVTAFPWIGLAVGLALMGAGAHLLAGGHYYTNIGARLSAKLAGTAGQGFRGYLTFGIAYGLASLSCTLPVFLAVIGGGATAGGFGNSVLQLALYGAGMGTVILLLTIGIALFKGVAARPLRLLLPYIGTASALLLLVSGTFIVYYWLTLGQLLERVLALF